MFRIDDTFVVDATLFGNEARFINHSCEVRYISWSKGDSHFQNVFI